MLGSLLSVLGPSAEGGAAGTGRGARRRQRRSGRKGLAVRAKHGSIPLTRRNACEVGGDQKSDGFGPKHLVLGSTRSAVRGYEGSEVRRAAGGLRSLARCSDTEDIYWAAIYTSPFQTARRAVRQRGQCDYGPAGAPNHEDTCRRRRRPSRTASPSCSSRKRSHRWPELHRCRKERERWRQNECRGGEG